MENCSNSSSIVLQNCDCQFPIWVCLTVNIAGLASAFLWFIVLVPQVIRSFRHKSVEGVSPGWAILNFTAAMNNTFFVFKLNALPLYAEISAVYMPILEIILLIEFWFFTKFSMKKLIITVVCCIVWLCIIVGQSAFEIYQQMEWLSITLWSIETFPQIFLNTKRQSTYGLSNLMVAISTIGKTTDFLPPYFLKLPLQYVVMAFFSSSVAIVQTVQVLYYWNQIPKEVPPSSDTSAETKTVTTQAQEDADDKIKDESDTEQNDEQLRRKPISKTCNFFRMIGMVVFVIELGLFAVGIVWRTASWWAIAAPALTYTVIALAILYYRIVVRFISCRSSLK